MHNAELGCELLDSIVRKRGIIDMSLGARKFGRGLARERGHEILDKFVYTAFGRKGWMVPNQYWTPGVLIPMSIMGKYYMHYGAEFLPPRELGRKSADRFLKEVVMDNLGICRFHRGWAEDMLPEIMESLFGLKDKFMTMIAITVSRINSRNASVFWETERNHDLIYTFLKRKQEVEGCNEPELLAWIKRFEEDKHEAGLNFWYEVHKGIHESLREF